MSSVEPFPILIETILPAFAADARDNTSRIIGQTQGTENEIPIQDGFDIYKELVEIRRVHSEALPK